ncbi:MAG: AMP-binding protein [Myxococcota bacterium]
MTASTLHNVGSWLPRWARIAGGRPAVVDEERRLDYAALDERSARAAGWLAARGVGPGDRVVVLLQTSSPYLEAVFAAARLGAIAVPVNHQLAPPELRYVLEDCRPGAILHEQALSEKLSATGLVPPEASLALDDAGSWEAALAGSPPRPEVHPCRPGDACLLMYTSGTTGVPKGALLPHRKSLYNCLNAQLFFELTGADRVLVVLPLFHSFGLQILALPVLYAGGCVVLRRSFDAEGVWRAVESEGISFLGGVPTMYRDLLHVLDSRPGSFQPGSLRFLFTAGAAIPIELIHGFERHGLVLKQGFGQTETSILYCLDEKDAVRKAGSVGRPVFHAEVRVVSLPSLERSPAQWEDTAPGERGEIVVHGPITMLGYWNQPEETERVLRDGWLRTGDLAIRDAEGFVTLAGRSRELYISGGENVYPAQVEATYLEHPTIREIAVVGVADERWGEVGRAYLVLEDEAELDAGALTAWGRERLAAFKLPRSWVALPSLPRTASGKVQKHLLQG